MYGIYMGGTPWRRDWLLWMAGVTPLRTLWAGPEAVLIFFVLSGYVLSLPFWAGKAPSYIVFCLKRIIRLYPPYIVTIMVGFVAMMVITNTHPQNVAPWYAGVWNVPIDFRMLLDHFLMLASPRYNVVDGPIRTLAVEMQISLLFPMIIWTMVKLRGFAVPAALAFSYLGHKMGLSDTVFFLWTFVLGAELARNRAAITRFAKSSGTTMQGPFLAASITLLASQGWLPGPLPALLVPIGAAGLIVAAANFDFLRPFLQLPPVQWLGHVSYSLYLVHFIILLSAIFALHGILPLWLILVAVPPMSLVVAHVFWRLIEVPSIAWSHRISRGAHS